MENWSKKTIGQIEKKLKDSREKDIRFFRVDEFKRNINRIETFSKHCPDCQKFKIEVNESVLKIEEAISVPGKSRRNYDRLISQVSKHMHKKHGFYAPYYYTYLYSFFGIIAGITAGLILFKLFPDKDLAMFSTGFIIGLLPAYFRGVMRDKKIRTAKMLM